MFEALSKAVHQKENIGDDISLLSISSYDVYKALSKEVHQRENIGDDISRHPLLLPGLKFSFQQPFKI